MLDISERTKAILSHAKITPELALNTDPELVKSFQNNCENTYGAITIPLGAAGPLKVNGQEYVLPLATSEACLVASVNRGCKAIKEAGGCSSESEKIGITRAPVYKLNTPESLDYYDKWLQENLDNLQSEIAKTSSHLKILQTKTHLDGDSLFIKFFFDSTDAMGMNMATIACKQMSELIKSKLNAELIAISSNWCSDKKPSKQAVIEGRGFKASAKVTLSHQTLKQTLKADPAKLEQAYKAKLEKGSTLAGALGHNCHHANVVAAIYLATGQDAAHIAEGSLGTTKLTFNSDSVDFEVTLPSLVCGTVGGGTKLPHQAESLQLIGLNNPAGTGKMAQELSEVIAAAVLAGEISLLAAIASHDLADSHQKFR